VLIDVDVLSMSLMSCADGEDPTPAVKRSYSPNKSLFSEKKAGV
jgi:hypothetical protein